MRYVISDIHGCYNEMISLLEKIHFSKEDHLYVLGDCVDRGRYPMEVILDLNRRGNVTVIQGNHDYLFFKVIDALGFDLSLEKTKKHDRELYDLWIGDGGIPTADAYYELPYMDKVIVRDFLMNAKLYDVIEHAGITYVLAHAGIENYVEGKQLSEYDRIDFIEGRTDYTKPLFADSNTILVTGHTPTFWIRPDRKPLIYKENAHIAIDCGCVYGGTLAAYCIETGEATYL